MLKIIDDVDLKELEKKYKFKQIQQNKRINYIYKPNEYSSNSIIVCNDRNLFNLNYYIDQDRQIEFNFNTQATSDFDKTISVLFDLIQAGLVEKVKEE